MSGTPKVIFWFGAYCAAMSLMYVALAVVGILWVKGALGEEFSRDPIPGYLFAGIGIPLAAAYAIGPVLPRRPWAWVYGLVLIGIGLSGALCIPAAAPLLIFWIKPEVKEAYRTE
jgi:hypothetical protein